MRIFALLPFFLATTALAGPTRRQTAPASCGVVSGSTLCRSDSECGSADRCQFVTRNPDNSGCDGFCSPRSSVSSSSTSSSPAAQATCGTFGTTVICRVDSDCGSSQRCQFGSRNPNGSGCDGSCVALVSVMPSSTSSSAAALPTCGIFGSTVVCRGDSECGSNQRCQFQTRNPDGSGCDGSFVANPGSTPSSTSSSAGPLPTCGIFGSTVVCRGDSECGSNQRCQVQTRNPDGSGCDGSCVASAGSSSSSSSSASIAVSASSTAPGPAVSSAAGQCIRNLDCASNTTYCNQQSQCVQYLDCRGTVGSCPGGSCVPAGNLSGPTNQAIRDPYQAFVCTFPNGTTTNNSSSSASSSSASASAVSSSSASIAGPASSMVMSSSAAITPSASHAPSPAASSIHPAPASGHPAPSPVHPAPSPAVHTQSPGASQAAPVSKPAEVVKSAVDAHVSAMQSMASSMPKSSDVPHPAPAPSTPSMPSPSSPACSGTYDLSSVLNILKQIKEDTEALRKDVAALKVKVGV